MEEVDTPAVDAISRVRAAVQDLKFQRLNKTVSSGYCNATDVFDWYNMLSCY